MDAKQRTVDLQPVAQVARLIAGQEAEQLGANFEEGQVANQFVLLLAAPKFRAFSNSSEANNL